MKIVDQGYTWFVYPLLNEEDTPGKKELIVSVVKKSKEVVICGRGDICPYVETDEEIKKLIEVLQWIQENRK